MVLWFEIGFKDKNFFILFPWQKYKCIFMNDTLLEKNYENSTDSVFL